ncbi:MAG TPA: SDR family oxidoreductase [Candidatus Sulfotelmatobacter sp.]|nr:SDR family oxidoreductase [Candidatus Sulfotelmatobacter sp.]
MASPQVVLISGTSTGFGRLFAETLARHGHIVFATMRDPAVRNAANANELRALAGRESVEINVMEMDVTDEVSVDRAVHDCMGRAGRIDVVINNAGYAVAGLTEATTLNQAREIMETNFFGAVRVNRAVLPFMRKQRSGLLMHVSSGAGRLVVPGCALYCATKFALEAVAEAYRYELAGQGIDSVIVQPGAYKTAVFGNMVTAADHARSNTYGAAAQIPDKVTTALSATTADAQEVADAVLSIVETPAGQRQLRYRVSPADLGVDAINSVCAEAQERLLDAFGLTADTTFKQQSAASAD